MLVNKVVFNFHSLDTSLVFLYITVFGKFVQLTPPPNRILETFGFHRFIEDAFF